MGTVEEQIDYIKKLSAQILDSACQFSPRRELLLDVLGLDTTATTADIETRYRKLSKHFHPDKFNGDSLFFKAISNAHWKLIEEKFIASANKNAPSKTTPHETTPTYNAPPPRDYSAEWEKIGRELIKNDKGPLSPIAFSLLISADQKSLTIYLGIMQQNMDDFFKRPIAALVKKATIAENKLYVIGSEHLHIEKRALFPLSVDAFNYLAQKDQRTLTVLWGMQQENIAFDEAVNKEWFHLVALAEERYAQHIHELSPTDAAYAEKGLQSILDKTADVPDEIFEAFNLYLKEREKKELLILLGRKAAGESVYEERMSDLCTMAVHRVNLIIAPIGMKIIRENSTLYNKFNFLDHEDRERLKLLLGKKETSRPFDENLLQELLQRAEDKMNEDLYNRVIQNINANLTAISPAAFKLLNEAEQKSLAILFCKQLDGRLNEENRSLMTELIQKAENQLKAQTPKPLDETLKPINTNLDIIKINCESVKSGIEALAKGHRSVYIEDLERRLEKQDADVNNVNNELLAIQAQYEQSPQYEKIAARQKEYKKLILTLQTQLKQEKIKKEEKTQGQLHVVGFFSPTSAPTSAAPQISVLAISPAPAPVASQAPAAAASPAPAPAASPAPAPAASPAPAPIASPAPAHAASSTSSGLQFRRLKRG